MNRLLLTGLLVIALAAGVVAQPSSFYLNTGTLDAVAPTLPPQIYATNFENDGTINIVLESFNDLFAATVLGNTYTPPFGFADVLNYTNKGTLTCDAGFLFNTAPSASHGENFTPHMAANFINTDRGFVSAGSGSNIAVVGNVLFASPALPLLTISSTNIISTGQLDVGENGLLSLTGNSARLGGSTLTMEFPTQFSVGGNCAPLGSRNPGIFDDYWGGGRGTNAGASFNPSFPSTAIHRVTTASTGGSGNVTTTLSFSVPNPQAIANDVFINGDVSNHVYQAVFFGDVGRSVSISARFQQCAGDDFAIPVIQWLAVATNAFTGLPVTNTLYLSDFFGGSTNTKTMTNASLTGSLISTQSPVDYEYDGSFPGYSNLFAGIPVDPTQLASGAGATNSFIAYGVNLLPLTATPDPTISGSTFSNSAGRIEITANQYLDLNGVTLTGPNYLALTATNHFAGSQGSQFLVPVTDLNLGSTNGSLNESGLVSPSIPRITDTLVSSEFTSPNLLQIGILAWSSQWTNVVTATNLVNGTNVVQTTTNRYHVLMVASELSPSSPTLVENLVLRSRTNSTDTNFGGNVVIGDFLNINSNLLVNAQSLTLVSNAPGAPNPVGVINWLSPDPLWTANLPNLQSLTNSGIIETLNTAFFEHRQTPSFPSPTDGPLMNFVNHGTIFTGGNQIWANYFENTSSGVLISSNVVFSTNGFVTNLVTDAATIDSSGGTLSVQANDALMKNGLLSSAFDMSLTAGNMVISNQSLQSGGALTFQITNALNFTADGSGRTWTNTILTQDGFSLLVLPTNGDLMGSTITSAIAGYGCDNTWAGRDLGNNPAGFTNNLGLGHVIFDSTGGKFRFHSVGVSNAVYIDFIDLRDVAATENNPNFTDFLIDPGLTIYFGGASNATTDISEKLNGANGGRFQWVSNFNDGLFSSVLLTNFPSGKVYRFNRALRNSCDIDSNGDGIVNCSQSFPFFVSENLVVSVKLTNSAPGMKALVSWTAPPNSVNYLYARTNLTSTNWTLVTNFVQGAAGPVTVSDKVRQNGSSLYRVIVHVQP